MMIAMFISTLGWSQLPTAQQISSQMKVGWNLGNTLESICSETAWNGGVVTTQALIDKVKASGFNTVRLPVSWDCHATNGVIDPAWLARVKQVVDYCINDNLYVIVNIHWDNGWLDNHINSTDQASIIAKQKNYWTQIGNYFKNYNEHLLFAGSNEPPVTNATEMSILLSYHQAFIDAVRATGGNNSSRTLIVQGPSTDIEKTYNMMNTMPSDQIANRLIVEVHYYSPYQFTIMDKDADWGKIFYYWGNGYHSTTDVSRNATWGEESYVEQWFRNMKTKFIDKGIPVIIGEFGAYKKTISPPSDQALHNASIEYFHKYIVNSAVTKGIIPIYWDINGGLFNRSTLAVTDQGKLNAIMQGAGVSTTTIVTIKNRATGLLMDGMGRTSVGSVCGQWANSGSWNQMWILETSGAYVYIKNRNTGLYIDGRGISTNGSYAGQWSSSTSNNLQWQQETTGGYVKFKNRATGLYLDGMGNTTNGADLGQWSNSSSNNQQWTMTTTTTARAMTSHEPEGVNIEKEVDKIRVFPNPFTSGINVSIREPEKVKNIIMLDLAGKQLEIIEHEQVKTEQTIGSHVNPGIYMIQINSTLGRQSFKVIKK
jgi:aryl-phospho-beta-D-glucosidase BglC (GH1 family)